MAHQESPHEDLRCQDHLGNDKGLVSSLWGTEVRDQIFKEKKILLVLLFIWILGTPEQESNV